ncbi:hypothetical protein HY485_05305 [Candidatus Woesearchaeota archaeon]|nr:hypothetical protein [Candidatus Woesearchaeota archaeon]
MNKQAQGLPITTVILAALGLVVLLILFGILTGKLQWFGKGLVACPGTCMLENECEAAEGYDLGRQYIQNPRAPADLDQTGKCETTEVCCSSRKK